MKTSSRHLLASGALALALAAGLAAQANATSSVVTVPPPMVADYWVSVSLQPEGALVFDGYAPDATTRSALGERAGADVNWLKLGSGAPAAYAGAMDFGLKVLERLSEGRFALRGSVLTFSGVAKSQADFIALREALATGAPGDLILAKAEIVAPLVEDYAFSARLQPNGNVILSGYAPDPDIEQRLLSISGSRSSSTLRFASGAPINFETTLTTAMPLIQLLSEGEVRLEKGQWLLSGTPASADDARSIQAAFADNRLIEAGWSLALAAPSPAAGPPAPYQWFVAKSNEGNIEMSGSLPTEALQRVLSLRVGENVSDNTVVVDSAPDGFINQSLAAAEVIAQLETGRVGFNGDTWFVEGTGKSAGAGKRIAELLGTGGAEWTVSVNDPVAPATMAESDAPERSPGGTGENATAENIAPAEAELVRAAPAQAELDTCQSALTEISAQNAILFRSGAAILAEGAEPILHSVAATLAKCPGAAIDVAGHTDSDGEAAANLALSVARAEAVIGALINLGVAPERLYALGYGESQPVAENGTSAGKAQNRRIVISVRAPS